MRRSILDGRQSGTVLGRPMLLAVLAQACLEAGLYGEGLRAVDEALGLLKQGFGRASEAELHRLQGTLLLKTGDRYLEVAEAAFQNAFEVAGARQALSWQLRAAVDLARIGRCMGRAQDAHTRLAAVYRQFGAGLVTRDLRAAGVLLDELSGS